MSTDLDLSYAYESAPSARAAFIRRTYAHLGGAILAFVGLETVFLNIFEMNDVMRVMLATPWSWLIVLGAFMGVSMLAEYWARSETSRELQYLGLGLYVVAEAIIFLPLMMFAMYFERLKGGPGTNTIATAGILTLLVFGGLTLSVFLTRRDYSFMQPILCIGSMLAFGVIICGIIFGFSLGIFFAFAMVALMSGFILYETSQVMLHFRTDQHVAAALMLFASIATLFWYILRIVMYFNSRD